MSERKVFLTKSNLIFNLCVDRMRRAANLSLTLFFFWPNGDRLLISII